MRWYEITAVKDPKKPFITRIKAGGKDVCVVGYKGQIFALGSWCPHAGADLSGGWCENGKLICPFHHYSYDLATGKGSHGQNDYIKIYPVKTQNDKLYIGISSFWERLKQAFT